MTRTISPALAPVLEQLELHAEDLVTTERLDELVQAAGIGTSTRLVAARLRERGWLLNTGERGVWEFAPAAAAGPHSRGGPTRLFRSFLAHSNVVCGLTFQVAAWALNAANRAPVRPEIAVANRGDLRRVPKGLDASVFNPQLPYVTAKGAPTLQPASILVHMAESPNRVRSWVSAQEWLPEIAAEATTADVLTELQGRAATVSARTGYLLQGLRADIAANIPRPSTTTWFGPRGPLKRRRDNHWKVADTLLPFNPRDLHPVTS
jgi:predicted transcriptional regulator of viral defense system